MAENARVAAVCKNGFGASDGLVPAGGASRRMGRDKAGLEWGGATLLDRQLGLLESMGARRLWVSVGLGRPRPKTVRPDVSWWVDEEEDAGPLAGIVGVLGRTEAVGLWVVAVDLPALDCGFLGEIGQRVGDGIGCVPRHDGHLEPLCAWYPVKAAREAGCRLVASGERAVRRLAETGLAEGWMRAWDVEKEKAGSLLNWNRPSDWHPTGA